MTYVDANGVLLEDLEQVFLDILKDQVEAAFALERLLQSHNVLIFEHAKHADLAHDCLFCNLVVVRLLEFLYSDYSQTSRNDV